MARREFPRKIRAAAIDRAAGHCEKCKAVLKPGEAEVDHILPDVLGGEPILSNAMVLCGVCHKAKTGDDIRRTRKADRQHDRATGAIRPKQSIRSAGFPQTRKAPAIEKQPVARKRDVFGRPVQMWTGSKREEVHDSSE